MALLFLVSMPRARAALPAAEYFPLAAGSTWTYSVSGNGSGTVARNVVAEQKTFHGVPSTGLRDVRDGRLEAVRWWSTSAGVQLHRWDLDERAIPSGFIFDKALTYLSASVSATSAYQYDAKAGLIPADPSQAPNYAGVVQGGVETQGFEQAVVPAGGFEVLKVHLLEIWTVNGEIIQATDDTWWLARNVGIVKADLSGEIWELTSYKIGGGEVPVPPSITTQPASIAVKAGGTAQFTVTAAGTAPLAYQWMKAGALLAGQTNASLTITNVSTANAGAYTVEVKNSAGAAISQAATLTIPVDVPFPLIRGYTRTPEKNFDLSIDAALDAQWVVEGSVNLKEWLPLGAAVRSGAAFQFKDLAAQAFAKRFYRVRSADQVQAVPVITVQPQSVTNYAGGTAKFTVTATGADSYQWQKNSVALSGQTSSTLLVTNVTAASAGTYNVLVRNAAGTVTSSNAVLTISQTQPITLLPEPGAIYKEGTTFGGPLFGVEMTIPAGWTGGLNPKSPIMTFTSPNYAAMAITAVIGFAGKREDILGDPVFRTGFESEMGVLGKVQFLPVDPQNPVKSTGPDRLTAEFAGQGQDFFRTKVSCVVDMVLHPSGGLVAFIGFATSDKAPALRAQNSAFVEKVVLTPRNTNIQIMAMMHGRSFSWSGDGSDWYRHEEGYYPSSTSLSSWSNSKAYFCSAGTFEVTTSSETIASVSNPSSGFFGISGTSETRDAGQWTVVQVPGFGNVILMVTMTGYQLAPIKVDQDGALYIGSTTMRPLGTFNCQQ